ncbi:MAG TPA: TetR/AcrR family transcriptional regulator [Kaistia sp.]|nr:TetR/AcrR family transcriptional regulator [Kaistia sp.]
MIAQHKRVYRLDGQVNMLRCGSESRAAALQPGNAGPNPGDRVDAEKSPKPQRSSTRDRIMEAATAVAHAVGPAHLSLDAVAEEAGVSKGGLLYHFPTKASLIKAVIERHLETVARSAGIEAGAPPPDGSVTAVALMRAFCATPAAKPGGAQGFLAALAETPELLEPIRDHNKRIVDCLRQAREPDIALMTFLVVEGLRCLQIFDANPISEQETHRIFATLSEILAATPGTDGLAPSVPPRA